MATLDCIFSTESVFIDSAMVDEDYRPLGNHCKDYLVQFLVTLINYNAANGQKTDRSLEKKITTLPWGSTPAEVDVQDRLDTSAEKSRCSIAITTHD